MPLVLLIRPAGSVRNPGHDTEVERAGFDGIRRRIDPEMP